CDLLSLLARADALGRECRDKADLLTNVELFREFCRDNDCLQGPKQFPSTHSRFVYFRTPGRDPDYLAYDDTRCRVTMMSGLPGAGKDAWIAEHCRIARGSRWMKSAMSLRRGALAIKAL